MIQLSDWLGWAIGAVFLILGIPISIYIGRRTHQRPDLRTATDFNRISGLGRQFAQGLTLTFKGQPLENVSRSIIGIWNKRGNAVRGTEILPSDPLRFEVEKDDEILQVRLVATSKTQVNLSHRQVEGNDLVEFDFLDNGDGGVFEVLHKGDKPAVLTGTLPGATITTGLSASLTFGSRRAMRVNHLQRFKYLRSIQKILTLVDLGSIVFFVVFAGLAAAFLLSLGGKPELASLEGVDLSTLKGQDAFATSVRLSGQRSSIFWFLGFGLIAASILGLCFPIYRLIRRFRRIVPASVVAIELDQQPSHVPSVGR